MSDQHPDDDHLDEESPNADDPRNESFEDLTASLHETGPNPEINIGMVDVGPDGQTHVFGHSIDEIPIPILRQLLAAMAGDDNVPDDAVRAITDHVDERQRREEHRRITGADHLISDVDEKVIGLHVDLCPTCSPEQHIVAQNDLDTWLEDVYVPLPAAGHAIDTSRHQIEAHKLLLSSSAHATTDPHLAVRRLTQARSAIDRAIREYEQWREHMRKNHTHGDGS